MLINTPARRASGGGDFLNFCEYINEVRCLFSFYRMYYSSSGERKVVEWPNGRRRCARLQFYYLGMDSYNSFYHFKSYTDILK